MKYKDSPLWIAGRVGILICFGIMPVLRTCGRIESRSHDSDFYEYIRLEREAVDNKNFSRADYWSRLADDELKKHMIDESTGRTAATVAAFGDWCAKQWGVK